MQRVTGSRGSAKPPERSVALSAREAQVLALVGQGQSNVRIGETLHLSRHTVARHIANARGKLDATNRAEAAVRFLKSDLAARAPRVSKREGI